MTTRQIHASRAPLMAKLTALPVYGVLIVPDAPSRGWFWAQAKKLGRTFSYNHTDGETVILRLK